MTLLPSFHLSWSHFHFITILCKSCEKTRWKKILAWWEELICLCVQDARSSWSPTVDSGYRPAVALSFSLVPVPLSLPSPIVLILLKLDRTKADSGHPARRSSLGFSVCWPGQPAGCPWLNSPLLQAAQNCHRSQWDNHFTSTFLPFLWVYVLETLTTAGHYFLFHRRKQDE